MVMSPAETFRWVVDAIGRLFTTPIVAWTWGQWLLMIILLSLVSGCLGRCACCRRPVRRFYYRGGRRPSEYADGYYAYGDRTTHRSPGRAGTPPGNTHRPTTELRSLPPASSSQDAEIQPPPSRTRALSPDPPATSYRHFADV